LKIRRREEKGAGRENKGRKKEGKRRARDSRLGEEKAKR
jgi:hypothetical protein